MLELKCLFWRGACLLAGSSHCQGSAPSGGGTAMVQGKDTVTALEGKGGPSQVLVMPSPQCMGLVQHWL